MTKTCPHSHGKTKENLSLTPCWGTAHKWCLCGPLELMLFSCPKTCERLIQNTQNIVDVEISWQRKWQHLQHCGWCDKLSLKICCCNPDLLLTILPSATCHVLNCVLWMCSTGRQVVQAIQGRHGVQQTCKEKIYSLNNRPHIALGFREILLSERVSSVVVTRS